MGGRRPVRWVARLSPHAAALGVAVCGALVFLALGLPAPWLSGAMCAVAAAALTGFRMKVAPPTRDLGFLMAGAALGASVTPDMLQGFIRYPVSLSIMVLTMVTLVATVARLMMWIEGWNRSTAILAAAPGALSAVMAVAVVSQASVTQIAISQSVRLFALVAVLPSLVSMPENAVIAATPILDAWGFAITLGAALLAGLALERLRVVSGLLLGGMLASAIVHLGGLVEGSLPPAVVNLAMLLIGLQSGLRFAQISPRQLALQLPAALIGLAVAAAIAAFGAFLAASLTDVPLGAALVAFAPGGLEAMIALALALGLDPLYVSVHHVVRFFGIGLVLPLVVRREGA